VVARIKRDELDEIRELVDERNRYVDLAVRLRIIDDNGKDLGLHPAVIGGRWDTLLEDWVRPTPPDLRTFEWTVQEQQLPILFDPAIFLAVFAGRQAGKTDVSIKSTMLDWLRYPGRKVVTIAQDFKASRDPEDTFKALCAPWWRVKPHKSDRMYELPHGCQYLFRSEEAIESVRGPSLKKIHMAEAALQRHKSFVAAVGCGVAARQFQMVIDTTPRREVVWIRKAYQEWGGKKNHAVHHLDTMRNPRRNEEVIEAILENTPADLADQELKGKLVDPVGKIWLFNRKIHLKPEPELGECTREFVKEVFGHRMRKEGAAYVAGWDFGTERCILGKVYRETFLERLDDGRVTQKHRHLLWWVGEVVDDTTNTEHHARKVAEEWGTNIAIIHDPMGAYRNSAGRGNEPPSAKLLREAGFTYVAAAAKRTPLISARQTTFNRMLLNSKHVTTTFVVPGACPVFVEALENQRNGPHGNPIAENGYEHIIDAATYFTWAAFPIEDAGGYKFRSAFVEDSQE